MKYYLKDNVTDEMLESVGFELWQAHTNYGCCIKLVNNEYIYINLGAWYKEEPFRKVSFDSDDKENDDITPYIQDLIQLGYVEVRND